MEKIHDQSPPELSDISIHAWIQEYQIKNEKGDPIEFTNHLFLYDIYSDQSDKLVCMKAAQIGFSTLAILKNMFDAHNKKMDIIYTLPTDSDVNTFVGGKVNRIIANNQILVDYTVDKDSIEQKQIGNSTVYFRGTWTKKSAIMVSADRLVHDEKDSSKQPVILDYQSRLQHSKYKQTHVFSHPGVPNNGVAVEWDLSDQKEWFIKCRHCKHEQHLSWNTEDPNEMSIDIEHREFVCKKCHGILSSKNRAVGRWMAQKPGAIWSGYHISLLMAPWVTADEIVDKFNDPRQNMDYFYNKVLGLPYAGSGNVVDQESILGSVTDLNFWQEDRLVIGVDTGKKLHYVIGNANGLLDYGEMEHYEPDQRLGVSLKDSLEYFLKEFPRSIMVIDQGGDIIGSRKLRAKYPGRVFLCYYSQDRKTMQLARWGEKEESGNVIVDRNRTIQHVIDEFGDNRVCLRGTRAEWNAYWLHWSHIYRVSEEDELGVIQHKWKRSDRDDYVHATVYWRVGIDRFGGKGAVLMPQQKQRQNSYFVSPDQMVSFNPHDLGFPNGSKDFPWENYEMEMDWRDAG